MIQFNSNSDIDPDFENFFSVIDFEEDYIKLFSNNSINGLNKILTLIKKEKSNIQKFLPTEDELRKNRLPPDEFDPVLNSPDISEFQYWHVEELNLIQVIQQQEQFIFVLNYSYFEFWFKNFYELLDTKYSISTKKKNNQVENIWKAIKTSISKGGDLDYEQKLFENLSSYSLIRNCIAHCKGNINNCNENKQQQTKYAIKKLNSKFISLQEDQIYIELEFIEEFQKMYTNFFLCLQKKFVSIDISK